MSQIDLAVYAINAAGIADAFACLESEDAEAVARFARVTAECGGHVGIIKQIADAAEFMERFRVRHGASAKWGGELPYLYDVWDSIAQAIWLELEKKPIDQIVESAIWSVMSARPETLANSRPGSAD
ncbi:MAG: hypothetical protein KF757_07250 [Phycisphaeraceae bacterium]|nr:hypothetical protein [Phycisphaeraceae bacterium]MCW5763389.1 hypothetical protein [Phycisphaeraceae bacterium]